MTSSAAAGPTPNSPEQPGLAYVRAVDSAQLSTETVGDALLRISGRYPDNRGLAWLADSGLATMTWAEIHARSSAAAATLQAINPSNARVALVAPNCADWVIAMFGCALAGMAVVPISPWATEHEARHMLSQTRTGVILAPDSVGGHPVGDHMRRVSETMTPQPIVRSLADLPVTAAEPRRDGAQPTDEFLVQHTSGTTGLAKAASLSHQAALNSARLYADAVDAQTGDTWLNPLPLHHVGGSVCGVLTALAIAGTYVVIERFSPQIAIRAVRETQPALLGLVPTMLIDLLAEPGVTEEDFRSVRTVISGATAVDPHLIDQTERRLGIRFLVAYGQSEAPCMTASFESDTVHVRTRTIGRPLPGRDYYVADRAGAVVETGSVGELCVRGPLTMTGYLRADGTLDPAADDADWRGTGDLCSMDEDGVLTFHGRSREVIIRGGTNIYPAEVEQAMTAHDSIAEIAVFGVPDERLGERVVAAVIPKPGTVADHAELAAFAETRLSRQKRPTAWMVVDDFPRTSTGKVRKHLLRERFSAGAAPAHP
jgi:fatty-acyl-CoA synthase